MYADLMSAVTYVRADLKQISTFTVMAKYEPVQ